MVNKVLRVGDSAAVTLPKQTLREMGVAIGDKVVVTFLPEAREIVIKALRRPRAHVSERVVRLTTNFIDRYRSALQKLA